MTTKSVLIRMCLGVALGSMSLAYASGGTGSGGGGGGGGGGTSAGIPQIAGLWSGQIFFPNPPETVQGVMALAEDAAGNITGQIDFGPSFAIAPVQGTAKNDGTFQLKIEGAVLNGTITGAISCVNGGVGENIGGSVSERGSTGSFTFNNCPQ